MKVLWYVNIVMPEAAKAIGAKATNAGGWLTGAARGLQDTNVELFVMSVTHLVREPKSVSASGITYFLIPRQNYIENFKKILSELQPDLVHIHGTEYPYNTQLVHLCSKKGTKHVVSLQGIMYQCAKHYDDGLPDSFHKVKPLLRLMGKVYGGDSIALEKKRFEEQGKLEIEALKVAQAVIGRTQWDKTSALAVNPDLTYYHVNENLRDTFYAGEHWEYQNCEPYAIFVSQGNYPIKGLHMLLNAMPELIKRYPQVQVYVGGFAPVYRSNPYLDRIVDYFFEYQGYIKKRIKEMGLQRYIHFTNPLTAEQMKKQFLKSNVFLSCSSIENSPNSVGEAMILGVPIVASNVGGTGSMLTDGEDGILYDFFDMDLMINAISEIFDRQDLTESFSENAKRHAKVTHDCEKNKNDLCEVYKTILSTNG